MSKISFVLDAFTFAHCTLVFHAVDKKVASREFSPQHQCGSTEQHLPHCQYPTIRVIERERVVDDVI